MIPESHTASSLDEPIGLQEAAVRADPDDLGARRRLIDLLAFAGRYDEAVNHLDWVSASYPELRDCNRDLRELLFADQYRSREGRKAQIVPRPAPRHAEYRRRAATSLRTGKPVEAVRLIDEADAVTPHLRGFLDGQEFEGLRDADDRYASVLEVFSLGTYFWFAWEGIRKVELRPAMEALHQLYRPARITFGDGGVMAVHLPLVYPQSYRADPVFALGTETDHICPDGGPTRCIGAKLLVVGDGAEVPLAACRMIEVR